MTAQTQPNDIIEHVVCLFYSVAMADKKLLSSETGMINDLISVNVRKIFQSSIPSRDFLEKTLSKYQTKCAKHWNDGEDFPFDILDEYLIAIDDEKLKPILLKQLLSIALADGEIHNNELAILDYISRKWGISEDYHHFQTQIIKALSDGPNPLTHGDDS